MLISLRIPNDLLAEVDAEARAEDRSRNSVLIRRIRGGSHGNVEGLKGTARRVGSDEGSDHQREGDRASLPVLRGTEGDKKLVHSVQSVRHELDERGGRQQASTCSHGNFSPVACRRINGGC
jgi:hypothetical protein